jgi:hypothetical protein
MWRVNRRLDHSPGDERIFIKKYIGKLNSHKREKKVIGVARMCTDPDAIDAGASNTLATQNQPE